MLRRFFGLIVCVLALHGFGEGIEASEPLPESVFPQLQDILERAVSEAPGMLEAALREEEARAEAIIRRSALYPSVMGSFRYIGRYEERGDLDGHRTDFQPQAGLTVRQPLFHWGSLRAEDRVGRVREAMAGNERREAFRLLALELRSQYLELVLLEMERQVAEREHALTVKELEGSQRALERNEITEREVRARQWEAEEAELRVDRLATRRDFARRGFGRLAGILPSEIPEMFPELEIEGPGGEDGGNLRKFGERPPRLVEAEQRVREASHRRDAERSRVRPTLDFVAGVTQDQVAVLDRRDIDRTVFFAGLEVRWHVFDGFEARGRRAAATARQRFEERRKGRLEEAWQEERERRAGALDGLERELLLAERRSELAFEDLEEDRVEFETGRISEIELERSELAYVRREFVLGELRAEYLMQRAEYLSEAGRDPIMTAFEARTGGFE